ncbi:anti-sigma B factor antagonist [Selenomonas ruminantium]|uniref:Anti-sigma factor antagonist n=1 Tax=Selenomonas ruminantium TaxID=971 RepID=A0A1M6RHF5_SELRU|nr:STAS domain-containing protein [Selenomonas ruminantium]SHK31931.1 anti-sigma B factor antagonist [Selenomonas ruminantium]
MASEIVQKETKLANGWLAWSVEGRIDISTADSVYQSGEAIVEREEKTVLDMSGVVYISSAGLRVLLRLLKKAKKEGKEFTVAGAAGAVKTVLTYSNMDTLLNLRESLDDL